MGYSAEGGDEGGGWRESQRGKEVSRAHTSHYQLDPSEKTTARRNTVKKKKKRDKFSTRRFTAVWSGRRALLPWLLLLAPCPGRVAEKRAL